jgi:hypothetical protein
VRAGDTAGAAPLLKGVCPAALCSRRCSQARTIHIVAGRGRSSPTGSPSGRFGVASDALGACRRDRLGCERGATVAVRRRPCRPRSPLPVLLVHTRSECRSRKARRAGLYLVASTTAASASRKAPPGETRPGVPRQYQHWRVAIRVPFLALRWVNFPRAVEALHRDVRLDVRLAEKCQDLLPVSSSIASV